MKFCLKKSQNESNLATGIEQDPSEIPQVEGVNNNNDVSVSNKLDEDVTNVVNMEIGTNDDDDENDDDGEDDDQDLDEGKWNTICTAQKCIRLVIQS